jgi:phosphoribosylaminoimidazolecarboxamide formyltransferase/IMP cyclohydrolase
VELVSTGGTARELAAAGLRVRAIEDFTGFPEMLDGRVKTLHPRLYAGLLAVRDEETHLQAAADQGIEQVDLVCVNLYPFEETLARGDASEAEMIENIDIGGPTMIRAAAKNHAFAAVLVDPADYGGVLAELRASDGRLSPATRERLAGAAFACTARYDAVVAGWFASRSPEDFRAALSEAYEKVTELRYGENPHQRGAYYARAGAPTHLLGGVVQLHGKELSFNNLLDLSSARALVEEVPGPGPASEAVCAIVKHNNPCGCATGRSAKEAYERAFACDPESAYGGVIALNRPVDRGCAEALAKQFIEVLLAPGYAPEALEVLEARKNVRLLELAGWPAQGQPGERLDGKSVLGGLLLQDRDVVREGRDQMRVMSGRAPSEQEWEAMLFAWRVCKQVRSNAIVIAVVDAASGMLGATIGIGAGQMSRVDAVRIAVEKARHFQPELLPGSALASDAFFPFPDGPQLAIDAGVSAIIQPGGSVRDELTLTAVDAAGAAMVATDIRHFRH